MKKQLITIIITLLFLSFSSKAQIDMSVYGGISTPNEKLGDVYQDNENIWELLDKSISIGWHLGARVRLPVDTGLFFYGGFGWHRFNDVQIEVKNTDSNQTYSISAMHDIIPISAGLQFYITRKVIKFYILGELNYNYFSTQGSFIGLPAPNFNLRNAANRMGFNVGAGVEFNLVLVYPFLEFNYAMPNLIGKDSGEPTKSYFNISLGINL